MKNVLNLNIKFFSKKQINIKIPKLKLKSKKLTKGP